MDGWNKRFLYNEYYQIAIGVSVITYFQQTKDFIRLAKITEWAIIFLFITAIMTIISSVLDPEYARNMTARSLLTESELAERLNLKRYGGGTYSTAGAFMSLFPIVIYYYKNIKISLLSRKQIIILSIVLSIALLGMQIFGNIVVSVVFSIIALLGMKRIRQSIMVVSILLLIVLMVPKEFYSEKLISISEYFQPDSDLNFKFRDMATFIETGANISDNSTGIGSRAERYPILMATFIKTPLLGCYNFSDESGNGYIGAGAHLYWMNKLTISGILGLIFFLIIPYNFIRKNLKIFKPEYRFYYFLAAFSVLSYGLMKVIAGRETWYAFFIIIPGLYYLPLLKIRNSELSDPQDKRIE